MHPSPGQNVAAPGTTREGSPEGSPSALAASVEGLGQPLGAAVGCPRSPLIRLLRGASAGLVSILLLALAIQGSWNTSFLASARSAAEASEGEEVATPSAIERIRNRRQQDHDPAPPVWSMQRLDEIEPLRVTFRSAPVFVDSRSGKQRVYLLRHLLI